jgi:hypothetical protein
MHSWPLAPHHLSGRQQPLCITYQAIERCRGCCRMAHVVPDRMTPATGATAAKCFGDVYPDNNSQSQPLSRAPQGIPGGSGGSGDCCAKTRSWSTQSPSDSPGSGSNWSKKVNFGNSPAVADLVPGTAQGFIPFPQPIGLPKR